MHPIIKWPGGKAEEIKKIESIIPPYKRYVEPFVGGGAVYFYLPNTEAIINDISDNLIHLYELIKENNADFKECLYGFEQCWVVLQKTVKINMPGLLAIYTDLKTKNIDVKTAKAKLLILEKEILKPIISRELIKSPITLCKEIERTVFDKIRRTIANEIKLNIELSYEDLIDNIITGFTGGFYMYIRSEHNKEEKNAEYNKAYRTSLFYFVREFCYGSMFRYNSKGDFNIPYGGIAYNKKDFKKKIDALFSNEIIEKFKLTTIMHGDFEAVFEKLTKDDFMFVDPPYDTEFSDYEGRSFDKKDQIRLRDHLAKTKAKFILIIKNTDFIYSIYNNDNFKIKSFDKNYAYCVKNRNERNVDHLIITNF